MSPITKYKLTSLILFFLLFAAYCAQFAFPYRLEEPLCMPGDPCEYHLAYKAYVILLVWITLPLYIAVIYFYLRVDQKVKWMPLAGLGLLVVLLLCVHVLNRPENLDRDTYHRIMELLGGYG